jgi:cell wall assembly regulator SMI1
VRPADVLREAANKPLVSEDGEPVRLQLYPPLRELEISAFEKSLPCPLPDEIRELLAFCRGFEGGALDFVDFTGGQCSFEFEAAFPHGVPFAADGFGNFWVVDLSPTSREWGPIYFCHDAPVILYQSPHLTHSLVELVKLSLPPHTSLVDG